MTTENITFFLNETTNMKHYDIDIIKLQNEVNEIEINSLSLNDEIFQQVKNYYLNYTIKQLLIICDFYGIVKTKMKKRDIIEQIILFENNIDNLDIILKRREFWNYMNELKNDKFMKRFVIW